MSRPVTVEISGAIVVGTATGAVLAWTVRSAWWNVFMEMAKAFSTAEVVPLTERYRRWASAEVTLRSLDLSQLATFALDAAVASYFAWNCFALRNFW